MTTLVRHGLRLLKSAEVGADAVESRVRRFVASDESVDSYNSVIAADGWDLERYSANPVVLFGHASYAHPIGKGRAFLDGTKLMLDVTFLPESINPMAERTMRILDEGLMGASVGFEPIEWEVDEARETGDEDWWNVPLKYTKQRLLEVSVVTLPSNPNALPEGREQMRSLISERLDVRRAAKTRATAERALVEAPAEDLTKMVERIVRETRATHDADELRRRGKTSRS
jgi:phage head maturation protease